jgi:type I restriction enzyme S subunit
VAMYGATVGRLGILGVQATTNQAVCHIVPDPLQADVRFLFRVLETKVSEMLQRTVGGAQPNINQGIVRDLRVPLPPLEEQRRIAAILDQAETLRTERRQALAHLDTLTQSLFLDMFGDPQANPKVWRTQALTEFFQFRTGKLDSNAATDDGEYPFFTCSRENFRTDTYAFDCEALLLAGNNANADYSVKHYRGKFNAYQRTYVLTLADASNSYVYARVVLEMKLQELKHESKGSSTKYLTLGLMDRLTLPVPDPALQQTFATRIQAIEVLKATHRTALAQLDALFASLQQRAFAGEL